MWIFYIYIFVTYVIYTHIKGLHMNRKKSGSFIQLLMVSIPGKWDWKI